MMMIGSEDRMRGTVDVVDYTRSCIFYKMCFMVSKEVARKMLITEVNLTNRRYKAPKNAQAISRSVHKKCTLIGDYEGIYEIKVLPTPAVSKWSRMFCESPAPLLGSSASSSTSIVGIEEYPAEPGEAREASLAKKCKQQGTKKQNTNGAKTTNMIHSPTREQAKQASVPLLTGNQTRAVYRFPGAR